ncbi:tabersonine 6,7-epoxidase [Coffea arabica]|uniref:Tabersonine 6,7-epoxidase n=1 Tax=Coffea arabica TaxID=13443 RepID=A0A6P6S4R0_COFAR|nr:tabersonine 16-hydroxylase 1-like [Coffea arabica]
MEIILFLFAFLLFCSLLTKLQKKTQPLKLPPGPRQLPIIGNIPQLFGSLPHRILRDLAMKHGPLMHLQLGELSTIIISSAEVAKEVMHEHDIIFASRPKLLAINIISYNATSIAFSPYGDYWRQLRKICTVELLSQKRVQTFRSIREEAVSNMIRAIALQEGSVVNLSKEVSSLTYSIIAQAAFGKKSNYQEEFISTAVDIVQLVSGFNLAEMYPSVKILERISGMRQKVERTHRRLDEILENILTEHREKRAQPGKGEGKEDLVDVLLNVQKSGEFGAPLTDSNLKAVILDIFSAGGETSSTAAQWTMLEMIKNPGVMRRAQEEIREVFGERGNVDESRIHELKYLQAVIKEAMRLHPPLPLLLPRECSKQCEIHGYEIPAKARVIINAWAIGRDPKHWTEPENFIPERFLDSEIDFRGTNFGYIPFGAGRRVCPGISFALPNVELMLAQLLYCFDWKLPGELKLQPLDMSERFGLAVRPKHDVQLIPISHNPSGKYNGKRTDP